MHCNGAQNVQPNHTYSLILSPSAGSGPSQATSINSIQNFAKQHVRRLIFLSSPLTNPHQSSSYLYHHLCYISDTIPALGWVVIAPHPAKVGKICNYANMQLCKMQNAKCKMQMQLPLWPRWGMSPRHGHYHCNRGLIIVDLPNNSLNLV